jgi:hypothetical protein
MQGCRGAGVQGCRGAGVQGCRGAGEQAGLQERVVVAHEQRLVGGAAEATRLDDDTAHAAGAQERLTRGGGGGPGPVQALYCLQSRKQSKGDGRSSAAQAECRRAGAP